MITVQTKRCKKIVFEGGVYYESKKIFTVTAVTVLLSMTLLTGCGDNSREKALEDQVSQLEQKVTDLQNSQNAEKIRKMKKCRCRQ